MKGAVLSGGMCSPTCTHQTSDICALGRNSLPWQHLAPHADLEGHDPVRARQPVAGVLSQVRELHHR